jgi:hypothetical protein
MELSLVLPLQTSKTEKGVTINEWTIGAHMPEKKN